MKQALAIAALVAAPLGPPMAQAAESSLAIGSSLRPEARPSAAALPGPAQGASSIRPAARPSTKAPVLREARVTDPAFGRWLDGFRARARAQGIPDRVLSAAFAGVTPDPDVIRRDRNQAEFTKTIWAYLDTAVSDSRVANGRAALAKHRETLARIEARHGVPAEIVTAIWGLESAYGTFRGEDDVIRSLATLAHDGRRSAFFEGQLIAALKILAAGEVAPREMKGSWAGAMGHTQFMPTSYLDYAVDGDGDGRRDIWGADPTDALASTAAYLAAFGWQAGMPWGVEVTLPDGFDYTQTGVPTKKMPADWAAMGVRAVDGSVVPDHGRASILVPAGHRGAAFMIFENFHVLERYNTADAYVIGVGHLADRIAGGPPIRAGWPRGDRALAHDERTELQRRLTRAGFDTQGIDGRIGPLTIAAIRAYQKSAGLTPDGYASPRLLARLR
jgi:lytic murein transglycosylase